MATNHSTIHGVKNLEQPIENFNDTIDEARYSRQLYVFGVMAQKKMAASKILICGLDGLGLEVAKNIILAGVGSVTIWDDRPVSREDLETNFCLNEKDLGHPKARQQLEGLRSLNPLVCVFEAVDKNFEENFEFLKKFQIVVYTDSFITTPNFLNVSDYCHDNGIGFILCESRGLFSRIFCDFGPELTILDPLGVEIEPLQVQKVILTSNSNDGQEQSDVTVATFWTTEKHNLRTGNVVRIFRTGRGWNLEIGTIVVVQVTSLRQFKIEGSMEEFSQLTTHVDDLYVTRVQKSEKMFFEKLSNSINQPKFITSDSTKSNNPLQIHCLFQALQNFGRLPKSEEDNQNIFLEAQKIAQTQSTTRSIEIDESLSRSFSSGCHVSLAPMNALVGGIVGQEILKVCGSKFTPLSQWLFLDSIECLGDSENCNDLPGHDENESDRGTGQFKVFGKGLQTALKNARIFVVGAGAIGCELLKNLALMDIGTGREGKVIVTDMDCIEKSNLCRQLLFRDEDIGQPKSTVAAAAIKKINPEINVVVHTLRLGPESEDFYDDTFFDQVDVIATAVDTHDARLYIDELSVRYQIPVLDSGTNGTEGSTQVIVPHVTRHYNATLDPETKKINMCTLRNFPNSIHHTIQWAREKFDEYFQIPVQNAARFSTEMRNGSSYSGKEELAKIKKFLKDSPTNFDDCVAWSLTKFERLFVQEISMVLQSHPENAVNSTGQPFWSGGKRCPRVYPLDLTDPLCTDFIKCAANLKATVHGISVENAVPDIVREIVEKIRVPAATNKFNGEKATPAKINGTDNQSVEDLCEKICLLLSNGTLDQPNPSALKFEGSLTPLQFDKDEMTNLHIGFVTAASNLRAQNYGILTVSQLKTKQIAGQIVPAIATTTSVVAAVSCLELYKLIRRKIETRPLNEFDQGRGTKPFKNCFLNLALPMLTFVDTDRADRFQHNGVKTEYTVWSRFEMTSGTSLRQLLTIMKADKGLDIISISYNQLLMYSESFPKEENEPYMDLDISEVVRKITGNEVSHKRRSIRFEIRCRDATGCLFPPIMYLTNTG